VYRFGWSLNHSSAGAEELLQETFLTCWAKRRSVHFVDESVLPWLLVVCRNHARNLARRERRHAAISLDEAVNHSAGFLDGGLAEIAEELDQLGEVDRQLIQLCLIEGQSYAEAARQLELTTNAVGKRLQKARAKLRKAVYENGQ
jgi:RNA polymerase sigma-70 factor (ECF subfamily)